MSLTKELSIFVDESGDFGPFAAHSPFYVFALVLHDQGSPIYPQVERLESALSESGFDAEHCFHIGPLIRREEDYLYMSISERRHLLNKLIAFARTIKVRYTVCLVEKKQTPDPMSLTLALSRQLGRFIYDNLSFFCDFARVAVYYDKGQMELNRVLASVFATILPHTEFKCVSPSQYRLFQMADLVCTTELIALKAEKHLLSKSEIAFFGSTRDMKKNYLSPIRKMRIQGRL